MTQINFSFSLKATIFNVSFHRYFKHHSQFHCLYFNVSFPLSLLQSLALSLSLFGQELNIGAYRMSADDSCILQ